MGPQAAPNPRPDKPAYVGLGGSPRDSGAMGAIGATGANRTAQGRGTICGYMERGPVNWAVLSRSSVGS
jgi:hypothetical protein